MLTLKKNYEFQKTLKKGKWYGGNLLNVYIVHNYKEKNYIGVAVGKKVSKSSVKRNRIRRLIKEAYRLNEEKIKNGLNIVIVWKTSCVFELANFYDIQKDLICCFKKADVLKLINEEEDVNV